MGGSISKPITYKFLASYQAQNKKHFLALKPPPTHRGRGGKMAFQGPILDESLKFHLDSTQPNLKIVFMDWLPPTMAIFKGIFWAFGWVPKVSLNFPKQVRTCGPLCYQNLKEKNEKKPGSHKTPSRGPGFLQKKSFWPPDPRRGPKIHFPVMI